MDEIKVEETKMELQIIENVQKFVWNFDNIKANLNNHIKKYRDLVVTEDNLKDMELAQREIASLRTKVEAFRKKVKKELDTPYKNFESQLKELQSVIADAENPIKDQLLKYEKERIVKAESKLMDYAKETARSTGLRDENLRLIISSKWTQRTAKKNQTREEIVKELDRMLQDQDMRDAAEELRKQKIELVEQLCESSSELYSLTTPVEPRNVAHLTSNAGLSELSDIIKNYCKQRAEMEFKVANAVMAKPEEPKPAVATPMPEPALESPKPALSDKPVCTTSIAGPALYKITLEFTITAEQAKSLCGYIKTEGLTCKTVSKERA